MVFGMLPLALGIGAGAELRQSMGIGVIGGLLTSTLLTLVAVPVAYSLIDSVVARMTHRRSRHMAPPPHGNGTAAHDSARPAALDGSAPHPTPVSGLVGR
jgi:hypothetical protein